MVQEDSTVSAPSFRQHDSWEGTEGDWRGKVEKMVREESRKTWGRRDAGHAGVRITSLSHEPVAKISGGCKAVADTGRQRVLLIFWDTYLPTTSSIFGERDTRSRAARSRRRLSNPHALIGSQTSRETASEGGQKALYLRLKNSHLCRNENSDAVASRMRLPLTIKASAFRKYRTERLNICLNAIGMSDILHYSSQRRYARVNWKDIWENRRH